jgi:hypothetical protein
MEIVEIESKRVLCPQTKRAIWFSGYPVGYARKVLRLSKWSG